ncbi:MAG TPA: hypothetical protein VHC42_04125 [Rhizomicrobium sp.]|nr:hypothetical protein [Rhizomicrobium sp.]
MKTMFKTGAAALALLSMADQSWAAGCARPEEAIALKAAAMQQELMVAALYCNDVAPYNHFVVSHQRELQKSDAMLLRFFVHGHGGAAAYHAYKTGLANDFSLTGLHGMQAFCAMANAHFDAAQNAGASVSLASFVSSQTVQGADGYRVCERTAEVKGRASRMAARQD